MARANLTVNDEVVDAFKAAQEQGSSVRFLKVQIEDGKEELSLASSQPRNAGPAEDFEDLVVPALESDKACIIVFRVSAGDEDASTVFEGAGAGVPWMMVCWTPESAKVREKMLYSSSREDLKESLGRALITQEFVATAAGKFRRVIYR
jgi:twinfilin-like protein